MLTKILSTLMVCFLTITCCHAQLIFKKFYTKGGKETTKPEEAHYYRVIEHPLDKTLPAKVEEIFIKTNTLKMKGVLKNASSKQFVGKKYELYENGNLKTEESFFENGQRIDTAFHFYNNGLLKIAYHYPYTVGAKQKLQILDTLILVFQDSIGNILLRNGTGYAEIGNKQTIEKGNYVDNKREGEWTGHFQNGKYSFVEKYENGKLVSGTSTDSLHNVYPYDSSTFMVNPEYPNGSRSFQEHVIDSYRYPREAIDNKVSGTIRVSFFVDKDGKMVNYVIDQDLGFGTGDAAINALKSAKKWKPGIKRGVPVRVKHTIPIRINLSGR